MTDDLFPELTEEQVKERIEEMHKRLFEFEKPSVAPKEWDELKWLEKKLEEIRSQKK